MCSVSILMTWLMAANFIAGLEIGSRKLDIKAVETASGDKVHLKVYYESLCFSCAMFHIKRLDVALRKIGSSYIDLRVYPYGIATRQEKDGKTVITCQHGETECYGNKLHACAIESLKNATVSEFYISCMMNGTYWGRDGSTDKDATECGDLMKIDSKPVKACAKSQKGEDLLEYYGRETEKANIGDGVPYVTINGAKFDLYDDLLTYICAALTPPPPACKEYKYL